jgi:hypothetical protein
MVLTQAAISGHLRHNFHDEQIRIRHYASNESQRSLCI